MAFKPLNSSHLLISGLMRISASCDIPLTWKLNLRTTNTFCITTSSTSLVTSGNLKDGVERINDELKLLWLDYVEEETGNLTEGGIVFRNKLRSLLDEGI